MVAEKEVIEKYISEFDKKAERYFDNYQETGSPSYERTYRKYRDLAEALRVALENDDDRNCDRDRRCRNIKNYAERLADKTYTKDEVKDILLEVAYWR